MKILAINSSYRGQSGRTQFLIEKLTQGIKQGGADIETVILAQHKILHCLNCSRCQQTSRPIQGKNGYELHCVLEQKDDVQTIFQKMAEADLIIYATPVYVFGMSALLKMLFERLFGVCYCHDFRLTRSGLIFHHVDHQIVSKPFAALICCDNLENLTPHNSLDYFKTYSRFMDAPQVGTLVRNSGGLSGQPGSVEEDRFPKLQEVYRAYRQAGLELAQFRRISRSTQRRANQEVLPVPLFGVIKRLPIRSLKEMFIEKANEFQRRGWL